MDGVSLSALERLCRESYRLDMSVFDECHLAKCVLYQVVRYCSQARALPWQRHVHIWRRRSLVPVVGVHSVHEVGVVEPPSKGQSRISNYCIWMRVVKRAVFVRPCALCFVTLSLVQLPFSCRGGFRIQHVPTAYLRWSSPCR